MRLIAALDKSIPWWLEPTHKREYVEQFDLALAQMAREAGGQISVAEAYRNLSKTTEWDSRRLTITNFLRMLRSVQRSTLEFKDPQTPIIRESPSNAEVFVHERPVENGKASAARKIHSIPAAIPFFGAKNGFCESHAVARR